MFRLVVVSLVVLFAVGCASETIQASTSGFALTDSATTTSAPVAGSTQRAATASSAPMEAVTPFDRPPLLAAPPTEDDPATIMVLGDSVTFELAPAIIAAAASMGSIDGFNRTQVGLGLSLHDQFPWSDVWAPFVEDLRPDIVLMQVGLWDVADVYGGDKRDPLPDDPRWDEKYAALMDRAVDIMSAHGAHVYWLEMLPSPDPETAAQMNGAIEALAGRDSRVSVIRLGEAFTDEHGEYIEELDSIFGPLPIRKVDQVHVCRGGAALAARVISEAFAYDFGLEVTNDWEGGEWINDPRYDLNPCPDVA